MAKETFENLSSSPENIELLQLFQEKVIPGLRQKGVEPQYLAILSRILSHNYLPLVVKGKGEKYLAAFYYCFNDEHYIVIRDLDFPLGTARRQWEETFVQLPDLVPFKWESLLTNKTIKTTRYLDVGDLLDKYPLGILKGISFSPVRRAGILMHVSSLPGAFGIGDFGAGSKAFIDFLKDSGQQYWQVLPLNISGASVDYSPYSSFSAFAGNPLYIDPVGLVNMGLVDGLMLNQFNVETDNCVNFEHAGEAKNFFLERAWEGFKKSGDKGMQSRYSDFCRKEDYWLTDYALFDILKKKFHDLPWQEWPAPYRDREEDVLKVLMMESGEAIEKISFQQFVFSEQWHQLKSYANNCGVKIFGDMPIYVSYQSADVWAHPELFRLKADKSMEVVAGVPPDYFNENGQLWGMPLFNWSVMAEDGYDWWLKRIGKNLEWFDLLRLDHFRGFSAFWEVPSEAQTAVLGKWVAGPGTNLFDAILKGFPQMPFVAEDLGKTDKEVFKLRDRYGLPGMKILQFGFDRYMPFLDHTPCNYSYNSIVYTGTHDNNTVKGWFNQEVGKGRKKRFERFTGIKLTRENCSREMIRLAYASTAKLAIIPMQDWLDLNEKSRMNFPAGKEGNWRWRMRNGQLTHELKKRIVGLVKDFGRY